jgi:hypothetical protein
MAQPEPPPPVSAPPAEPFSGPPFAGPPFSEPPPAPPTVRGQRLAWVLGILCGLLLAAGGVGGTIFATNLSGWNKTIADQQSQIEALQETEKSQQNTLDDRDSVLSRALQTEVGATATDNEATRCRQSVAAFLQTPLADQAVWTNALIKAFNDCRVRI